jgi:hypothetical protein
MVVVVVLPLSQLVVEQVGVVDENAVKHAVELFGVDAVRPFNLAVEPVGRKYSAEPATWRFISSLIDVRHRLERVQQTCILT